MKLTRKRALLPAIALLTLVVSTAGCGPSRNWPPPPSPAPETSLDPLLEERIAELVAGLETSPDDARLRSRLAMTYEANGLYSLAIDCYRQLLDRLEDSAELWYRLARSLERDGKMDEAIKALERSVDLADEAVHETALLVEWLLDSNRIDEAAGIIEAGTSRSPHLELARARVLAARSRLDEAESLLLGQGLVRGVLAKPSLYLLAKINRESGRIDVVESLMARAAEAASPPQHPSDRGVASHRVGVSSLQRQARVEIQRGDFGAALETLTKLRQLADGEDDPRIASMLAHCYLQLGRAGDAIETLTEAIATAPDQFSLQLNLAKSILVGVTQGAEGATLAGALSAIGRALQLRPESSDAWSTQGRILQAADRPDDALISYEKATQTDPQDAAPRVLSAHLHQSRADWAAVRLTLAPLVETQTQPTALLLAARAEVELGNLKGARSLVSRFGEEFSSLSDEELAEKIRRLSGETPASPPTTSHETNAPDPA